MSGIFYEITCTRVPNLVSDFHIGLGLGYAYETATHYVHFYGINKNLYSINTGQTIIENKSASSYKTLIEWVEYYFGAKNIQNLNNQVGDVIEGVWRPALYYYKDIYQALRTTEAERRLSEQALRILLEKFDDILLYIEPNPNSLNTYSHKLRELLILACMEVENFWVHYMQLANATPVGRNFTTQDYVKLKDKLFLGEFKFSLRGYADLSPILPFKNWSNSSPTASLTWYDAYNKTKHNRTSNFYQATFQNVLTSVVACITLYIARYSPYPLLEENGTFNSLVNQHFKFELENPSIKMSYMPNIEIPANYRSDIFIYDSKIAGDLKPYITKPLVI